MAPATKYGGKTVACPPGMTEFRSGRCGKPAAPPPSIVDYRPTSTVVADPHMVPRAKFPVIDIHNHTTVTAENIEQLIKEMDSLNIRVLNNLSGGNGDRLKRSMETIRNSRYADRFTLFVNVDWEGAGGPGWKERAVAQVEEGVKNGAIGLKVFKNLGLSARKLQAMRGAGNGPRFRRHSRYVRYHIDDLDSWSKGLSVRELPNG